MDRGLDKHTLKKLLKVSSTCFKSVYLYINSKNGYKDIRPKRSSANDNFA